MGGGKGRKGKKGKGRSGQEEKAQNGLTETPWSSLAGTFIKAFVVLQNGPMQFFPTRRTSIQINYRFRF